jgi:hypothetical protein
LFKSYTVNKTLVDYLDTDGQWREAKIIGSRNTDKSSKHSVLLTYVGWLPKWDVWVKLKGNLLLVPHRTCTRGSTGPGTAKPATAAAAPQPLDWLVPGDAIDVSVQGVWSPARLMDETTPTHVRVATISWRGLVPRADVAPHLTKTSALVQERSVVENAHWERFASPFGGRAQLTQRVETCVAAAKADPTRVHEQLVSGVLERLYRASTKEAQARVWLLELLDALARDGTQGECLALLDPTTATRVCGPLLDLACVRDDRQLLLSLRTTLRLPHSMWVRAYTDVAATNADLRRWMRGTMLIDTWLFREELRRDALLKEPGAPATPTASAITTPSSRCRS